MKNLSKNIRDTNSLFVFSFRYLLLLYLFFIFLAFIENYSGFFQFIVKPFISQERLFPSYDQLVPNFNNFFNKENQKFTWFWGKKKTDSSDLNDKNVPPLESRKNSHSSFQENTLREKKTDQYIDQKEHLFNFSEKLRALKEKRISHVHILHWGDSIIWGDWLSYRLKERFQTDFGDGGRGIIPLKPSPAERLKEISISSRGFIKYYIPFESFAMKIDSNLGFLGYSYWSSSSSSRILYQSQDSDWDSVEVILRNYKDYPMENSMRFLVNNEKEFIKPFHIKPQECKLIKVSSFVQGNQDKKKPVRQIEIFPEQKKGHHPYWDMICVKNKQGLVYSALVQMGLHQAWNLKIPEENLQCGFQNADIDLILFQFGVNESASMYRNYRGFTEEKYYQQLDLWYKKIKKNAKKIPVLILGPYERLVKKDGIFIPHPSHEKVREIQKELARKYGFAYLDIYKMLGGKGHAQNLVDQKYILKDYIHLTHKGSFYLGDRIYSVMNRELYPDIHLKKQGGLSEDIPEKKKIDSSNRAIQFNSIYYYIFFFLIFYVAFAAIRFPNLRLILLLFSSYYFYATWMIWPLSLILISTVIDYFTGRMIDQSRKKNQSGRIFLIFSLISNLGLLAVFKYAGFFSSTLNSVIAWIGLEYKLPVYSLLLPVGISFYTFQTLSYTIDVYRGKIPVEKNFLRFALFVSFFPQLVAGPIVRAGHFLPAIKEKILHFAVQYDRFFRGIFIILIGLLKKTFGDYVGVNLVDRVFESHDMFNSWETLIAFYGYGLQIYGDFSGYSDIAIGSAMILGFHLTINFNRPYAALSVSDFWRRWHISLGSWIRDYLYIPLGGSKSHVYRNLIFTMFLAGLWHGAGFQFILWGLYLGFFLILDRILGISRLQKNKVSFWKRILLRGITLHIILFSWIIFRSSSLEQFFGVLSNISLESFSLSTQGLINNVKGHLLLIIFLFYLYQWSPIKWKILIREKFIRQSLMKKVILSSIVILIVFHMQMEKIQPFIYFQF